MGFFILVLECFISSCCCEGGQVCMTPGELNEFHQHSLLVLQPSWSSGRFSSTTYSFSTSSAALPGFLIQHFLPDTKESSTGASLTPLRQVQWLSPRAMTGKVVQVPHLISWHVEQPPMWTDSHGIPWVAQLAPPCIVVCLMVSFLVLQVPQPASQRNESIPLLLSSLPPRNFLLNPTCALSSSPASSKPPPRADS